MLEREGVEGPGGIAIVGSGDAVEGQLRHLAELGATDLLATIFPVDGSQTSVTRRGHFCGAWSERFSPRGPGRSPHQTEVDPVSWTGSKWN